MRYENVWGTRPSTVLVSAEAFCQRRGLGVLHRSAARPLGKLITRTKSNGGELHPEDDGDADEGKGKSWKYRTIHVGASILDHLLFLLRVQGALGGLQLYVHQAAIAVNLSS